MTIFAVNVKVQGKVILNLLNTSVVKYTSQLGWICDMNKEVFYLNSCFEGAQCAICTMSTTARNYAQC